MHIRINATLSSSARSYESKTENSFHTTLQQFARIIQFSCIRYKIKNIRTRNSIFNGNTMNPQLCGCNDVHFPTV